MRHLLGYLVGLIGGRTARHPLELLCNEIGCPVRRGASGRYLLRFPGGFGGTLPIIADWGDDACTFSVRSMFHVPENDFPAEDFASWEAAHAHPWEFWWQLIEGEKPGEPVIELNCPAATPSLDAVRLKSICTALSEFKGMMDEAGLISMVRSSI